MFLFYLFILTSIAAHTANPIQISKHFADASVDPLKRGVLILQKSILITFFIDTSVRELDLLQVPYRPGKVLKTLFGNFQINRTLPFLKLNRESVHRDMNATNFN